MMERGKLETDLREECKRIIEDEYGGETHPWSSPGNNFVPDRIVLIPGMPVIFAEYKKESGGVESKGQTAFRLRLLANGFHAYLIDSADTLRAILEEVASADAW